MCHQHRELRLQKSFQFECLRDQVEQDGVKDLHADLGVEMAEAAVNRRPLDDPAST